MSSGSADAGPPDGHNRRDFFGGLAWTLLGAAILAGSVSMDRLAAQGVNPYTVPGLMPGLLGIVMILLGALLTLRSRRFAPRPRPDAAERSAARAGRRHLALVLSLCLGFGLVLVGHGLPYWLSAALFVGVAIPALQGPARRAAGQRLGWRALALSAAIGLAAGGAITLVFQGIFLVRLP
jgi:hypothetical protein